MILKTLNEWSAAGRRVRKGEKAAFFQAAPDLSQGAALFQKNQTIPWDDDSTVIITREEWDAARDAQREQFAAAMFGPDDTRGPSI